MKEKQATLVEIYAKDRKSWRQWLKKNHNKQQSIWLIIYKKESATPSIYYEEAVEEALCFGWIDSKPNKRDSESFRQFFARRQPRSNWSALNKKRVEQLMEKGLVQPAGLAMIELAKKTGTWTALDKVEALEYPPDLQKAFTKNKTALENFNSFPKSVKKGILEWIGNAKKDETRKKRINETVSKAVNNIRANQWRP
jgi:uncharacterized protein YdeI (YjbR/CyaY-like superfamily)